MKHVGGMCDSGGHSQPVTPMKLAFQALLCINEDVSTENQDSSIENEASSIENWSLLRPYSTVDLVQRVTHTSTKTRQRRVSALPISY